MNNDRWEVSEVWYCKEWETWVVTAFDWDGNSIDESDYSYRKMSAIDTAEMYLQSDRCDAVKIFTKDERLQRVIIK